jgi:hypothetical protein
MGLYSRLSQGHEAQSTEADVVALALHHRPKHPTFRARWVNDEVQSIAVTISAGHGKAVDPNCCKDFLGMLAGWLHTTIHTTKSFGFYRFLWD